MSEKSSILIMLGKCFFHPSGTVCLKRFIVKIGFSVGLKQRSYYFKIAHI